MNDRRRAIAWTRRDGVGLEHLVLGPASADSLVLALDEQGRPFRLAYALAWTGDWRLREAHLRVTSEAGALDLTLRTDGAGGWRDAAGAARPALDGCTDIDIWPTPFTNTFPLRRAPLAIGERRELLVAWVSAPELTVTPMRQAYTRLAERRYLFESRDSGFRAELSVDADHVVVDYEGLFRRLS